MLGAIDDETAVFAESHGGTDWLCIVVHKGNPVRCQGIAIEMPTDAHRWAVPAALVAAAFSGTSALATLVNGHAAPGEGPWPDASGSAWWSSLGAIVQGKVRDYIVWMANRRPPI